MFKIKKAELFKLLDESVEQINHFFNKLELDVQSIINQKDIFKNITLFEKFADKILEKDDWRKEFFVYENTISSLYHACKPEIIGDFSRPLIPIANYLRGIIDAVINQQDIESAKQRISNLLDESIVTDENQVKEDISKIEYKIVQRGKEWDLSKVDFEKFKKEFKDNPYKNIEIADLRAYLDNKIEKMIEQNSTRRDFAEKLKEIIDAYNSGSLSTEEAYNEMITFTQNLSEEENRAYREGLTEDELEIYDLLKKEKLTKAEEQKVKLASKQLIIKLKEEEPRVLIQNWYNNSQSREPVLDRIEKILDNTLPDSYNKEVFKTKINATYNLVYDYALSGKKWVTM